MAVGDISLTAGMRANVLNLQKTAGLLDVTQNRLATGKSVNSALDDPVKFFASRSHLNRANDLLALKADMGEAIQSAKAGDAGITAFTKLLEAAKGIIQSAKSTTNTSSLDTLGAQFTEIVNQALDAATDSGYKGINLVNGDDLVVQFNEDNSSNLTISGVTLGSALQQSAGEHTKLSSIGLFISFQTGGAGVFSDAAFVSAGISFGDFSDAIQDAIDSLRTIASKLSTNLSVVTVRQDYTSNIAGTLTTGADLLTLADTNEEGANMLMLQTRQSLSTTALSLASQAAQSVLRLF